MGEKQKYLIATMFTHGLIYPIGLLLFSDISESLAVVVTLVLMILGFLSFGFALMLTGE